MTKIKHNYDLKFINLAKIFLSGFILLLPFQIKTLFFVPIIYSSGKFNPYLAEFIYLSDILIFLSIIFWGLSLINNKKKINFGNKYIISWFIGIILLTEISILISNNPEIGFFQLIRFIQYLLIYLILINKIINLKELANLFIISISIQSVLAVMQYIFQESLNLKLIGEPMLNANLPGIAKIEIMSEQFIRAYGTFPHPNILAGFIIIALFLSLYLYKNNKFLYLSVIGLLIIGLITTFSRSAILAGLIGIIILFISTNPLKFKKISKKPLIAAIIISLITMIALLTVEPFKTRFFKLPKSNEIQERMEYYRVSAKMIKNSPLGSGQRSFTINMQKFTENKLNPWNHQPVHNSFSLISNEIGIGGGLLYLTFFIFSIKKILLGNKQFNIKKDKNLNSITLAILSSVFIIFMFDHYFITIYQGQILFIIITYLTNEALQNSQNTSIKKIEKTTSKKPLTQLCV